MQVQNTENTNKKRKKIAKKIKKITNSNKKDSVTNSVASSQETRKLEKKLKSSSSSISSSSNGLLASLSIPHVPDQKNINSLPINSHTPLSINSFSDINENTILTLIREANSGNVYAQCDLAFCYAEGLFVEKSGHDALRLYRAASEKCLAEANYALGTYYYDKSGIDKGRKEVTYELQRLSGVPFYLDGLNKDDRTAVFYLTYAANSGHAAAQYTLGRYYYEGKGVEKNTVEANKKEAIRLFKLAADQGDKEAIKILHELNKSSVEDNKNQNQLSSSHFNFNFCASSSNLPTLSTPFNSNNSVSSTSSSSVDTSVSNNSDKNSIDLKGIFG